MTLFFWLLSCAVTTPSPKSTGHSAVPSDPHSTPHSTPGSTSSTGLHSGSTGDSSPCSDTTDSYRALAELTWPYSGNVSTACLSSFPAEDRTLESYRAELANGSTYGGEYTLYAAYLYRCTGGVSDGWTWVRVYPRGYDDIETKGALFDANGALVGSAEVPT
jgi:hypothetical protein